MWNVFCNIFYFVIALPVMLVWDAIVDAVKFLKGER